MSGDLWKDYLVILSIHFATGPANKMGNDEGHPSYCHSVLYFHSG